MPASASATEIAADLADLEDLLAKAQRPKVRTILQEYIASLRAEQATLGGATKAAPPAAPAPGPLSGLKDENKKPAAEPKKETQASLFGAAPAAPELEKAPDSAKKQPGATLFHSADEVPAAAIDPATYGGSGHVRPQTDTAAAIAKLASGLAEGMHTHTPAPAPAPVKLPTNISANAGGASAITWTNISSFGWDQDTYGKDPNFVYVYIMSGVDGVGDIKEKVSCEFTASAFDLKIVGLNGKNYRLLKNGLEKEIVPESSKVRGRMKAQDSTHTHTHL